MSAKKTLESAKGVLLGELVKYADIVASQRPASTPSKVARRQLAEIEMALQALDRGLAEVARKPAHIEGLTGDAQ